MYSDTAIATPPLFKACGVDQCFDKHFKPLFRFSVSLMFSIKFL